MKMTVALLNERVGVRGKSLETKLFKALTGNEAIYHFKQINDSFTF